MLLCLKIPAHTPTHTIKCYVTHTVHIPHSIHQPTNVLNKTQSIKHNLWQEF